MDKPAWVSEGSIRKYDRALAQLNKENAGRVATNQPIVPITDAAVKALYLKWGGLDMGGDEEMAADESTATEEKKADEAVKEDEEVDAPKAKKTIRK